MHPQLAAVAAEFEAATRRLDRLRSTLDDPEWGLRRHPSRWSAGECVAHLNLTGLAYRPILTDAIARAKRTGGTVPARLRRDPLGWLLWRSMPPPVRARTKTVAAFLPEGGQTPAALVAEFEDLQDEMAGYLRASDGLPVHRVRIASPFNPRLRYSLYSCFTILAAHQHRHLWQAEQLFPGRF